MLLGIGIGLAAGAFIALIAVFILVCYTLRDLM